MSKICEATLAKDTQVKTRSNYSCLLWQISKELWVCGLVKVETQAYDPHTYNRAYAPAMNIIKKINTFFLRSDFHTDTFWSQKQNAQNLDFVLQVALIAMEKSDFEHP